MRKFVTTAIVCVATVTSAQVMATGQLTAAQQVLEQKIALGKLIFHDTSLSEPAGQSCGSCHQSDKAYADPGNTISAGANPKLFANRNVPSIAYIKFNPVLHWDFEEKHWVGGFFYDGRETNIQSQAEKPFINPVEMGNRSFEQVVGKVKKSHYAVLLTHLYGSHVFADSDSAMNAVVDAIITYVQGPEFGLFSSKFDWYLDGKVKLTPQEQLGFEVFEAEDKGNCAACHVSQTSRSGKKPLFTDFTYDNLGLAKPDNLPFLAMDKAFNPEGDKYVDKGLGLNPNIHNNAEQLGKFKVPTLRNVAITGPYMHNGMFTDLKQVVDFYNTRDVDEKWGKPEIKVNVNTQELGDLKLNEQEVDALVAFMKTLTDGYQPTQSELEAAGNSQ